MEHIKKMVFKDMLEKDKRLLNQMIASLEKFKNDKIGVRRLIDDLESLINLLNDDELRPNTDWKDMLWEEWWVLEDEYSSLVCSGKTRFDDEQWDSIVKAVLELEDLIQKKINS